MDLITIYTITVFVALLLFYPVLHFLQYLKRHFTYSYPRLYHTFYYLLNLFLHTALNNLLLLILLIIPETNRFTRNIQYLLIIPKRY